MIAPPHNGSFVADFVYHFKELRSLYTWVCGEVGAVLTTQGAQTLPSMHEPVGLITADLGSEELGDGLVSLPASDIACAVDHMRLRGTHTTMLYFPDTHRQIIHFLEHGHFDHTTRHDL